MEPIKSTNVFISFIQTVRSAPVAFVFLVVSAFSSLYLYSYGLTIVHREEEARFGTVSKELKSLILSRYNRTIDIPLAVRSAYTIKDFSHTEFTSYIQSLDLKNRYPGFVEIGVVETKTENKRIVPAVSEHVSIEGTKGSELNKNNFLSSDAFITGLKEINQGNKVATVALQNSSHYILILPITKNSFLYTILSPDQLFNRLFLDNSFYGALDFKIIDTNKITPTVIFDSSGLSEDGYMSTGFSKQEPIILFDSTWTLLVHANEESLLVASARQLPSFIRVGGILISFLIFLVLFVLGRSRSDAVVLAHQMTKDLKQSEEKYKSIFESLQDVFYRTDKEGNVTTVSPSIYNYIGKTPETLIGKPATDFYKNPNDRASMIKELQKKVN
jgi:PAS domain-containing protein